MVAMGVGLAGLLGVLCRFGLYKIIPNAPFPWATLGINIAGSLSIGCLYGLSQNALSETVRASLTIGFLGGFTTFSAYALETLKLIETKNFFEASAYFVLSPMLGLLAAWIGALLTR